MRKQSGVVKGPAPSICKSEIHASISTKNFFCDCERSVLAKPGDATSEHKKGNGKLTQYGN